MSKNRIPDDEEVPPHDPTVKEAMTFLKGLFKFVSYAVLIGSAVVYVTRYMDRLDASLDRINATLMYKASISDINHVLKSISDSNSDVMHKDGSYGVKTPELVAPPTRPMNAVADLGGS